MGLAWTSTVVDAGPAPTHPTGAPAKGPLLSEVDAPVAGFRNGHVMRGRVRRTTWLSADGKGTIVGDGPSGPVGKGPFPEFDPSDRRMPTPDQQRQMDEIVAGKPFVVG